MKTTRAAFKNSILPKSVEGGEEIEVLVSPIGTFPHPDGEQLCTREAFDALVEKWRADGEPEILVDFDHASETGGPTEAAAWATALRSDEDGLHATFRMTDKGAEALSATRYRYLSPAWYVDEEGHPTELSTIALTNRPNLPVPRLLNMKEKEINVEDAHGHEHGDDGKFTSKGGGGAGGKTVAEFTGGNGPSGELLEKTGKKFGFDPEDLDTGRIAGAAMALAKLRGTSAETEVSKLFDLAKKETKTKSVTEFLAPIMRSEGFDYKTENSIPPKTISSRQECGVTQQNNRTPDMDKLKEVLGLAAEATDEEVLAAVDALRAERDQLRSEKEQMEAAAKEAALDAEAEEFVEEKKEFVADKEACKNAYKRDPEGARALFNALAAPKPAAPVDGKPARVVDVNAAQKPADADLLANCKSGADEIAWAIRNAKHATL